MNSIKKNILDSENLKNWFRQEKRCLPWRQNPSPYAVWISEVMLQQTRASVVIPYFERWLKKFPTIHSLAQAPIEDVIKIWEGLGYYSRARNLHAAAQYLVQYHAGNIPADKDALSKIKGLGPYTVGAILSFAFKQKVAAVDGNVQRVLARYFLIEDDIAKSKTIAEIRHLAEEILPEEEPWVFNEALIELGATVCMQKPKCVECPIQTSCKAYQQGEENNLPYKSKKQPIEKLQRLVFVITTDDHVLVRKVGKDEVMSDLHEFPYVDSTRIKTKSTEQLIQYVRREWRLLVRFQEIFPEIKHSFTRFQAHLYPFHLKARENKNIPGYIWVCFDQIQNLPFSSGHRRILRYLGL